MLDRCPVRQDPGNGSNLVEGTVCSTFVVEDEIRFLKPGGKESPESHSEALFLQSAVSVISNFHD